MAFWSLTIEQARSASATAAPVAISKTRTVGVHTLVDCDSMVTDSPNARFSISHRRCEASWPMNGRNAMFTCDRPIEVTSPGPRPPVGALGQGSVEQ